MMQVKKNWFFYIFLRKIGSYGFPETNLEGKVQDLYNRHHPHSALGFLSPKDFRELHGYPKTLEQTHRISEEMIFAPPLGIKLVKQASGPFLRTRFWMTSP